ncbi:MAG TPA: succinate dehydrogenase [Hyphomicrobiaceae bacterium]|nr:succinate dehydrogenase [Hyphomicrobiaceae bacterium]
MTDLRLYVLQRVSAALMLPFILAHLFVIFYATSNGLSAGAILSRTQGSIGWASFYGLFVLLAALHGAIGLRNILKEWTRLGRMTIDVAAAGFSAVLLILGARAVIAVVLA